MDKSRTQLFHEWLIVRYAEHNDVELFALSNGRLALRKREYDTLGREIQRSTPPNWAFRTPLEHVTKLKLLDSDDAQKVDSRDVR